MVPNILDLMYTSCPIHTCLAEGSLKGLKVEFSLPPSSYATMVIRELTRMDTSSAYQASLTRTDTSST